jgi:hypothetical protein
MPDVMSVLLTSENAAPISLRSIEEIRQRGFVGFVTISELQTSNCSDVPNLPGVYLVLKPDLTRPAFLNESLGGHFKGQNPTVPVSRLESKWVEDAVILNIGKAGLGRATLRSRLKQYVRFGRGEAVGHWGGRYIWQLGRSCEFLVCWKVTPEAVARTVEKALIDEFKALFGKFPFANLNR